jgi:Glyoxalase/Bleomycin resistance protein/Dioxygenase superfamily
MSQQPVIGRRFGQVVHVAYLEPDIDVAMDDWLRQLGVGPWTCIRDIELDASYNGEPLDLRIHEALAYAGTLQIQLVQSLNDLATPTPYQSRVKANQWGLHHVAYFSDDIDRDVAAAVAQGFGDVCEMRSGDGHRYYYLRSQESTTELWIEFLEVFPLLSDIYAQGIAETATWDGTNPVRNLDYRSF